jgi:hypothetical protein
MLHSLSTANVRLGDLVLPMKNTLAYCTRVLMIMMRKICILLTTWAIVKNFLWPQVTNFRSKIVFVLGKPF